MPLIVSQSGGPSVTMSSEGRVTTTIAGTPLLSDGFFFVVSSGWPSMRSTTRCFASSVASLPAEGGTFFAGVQGPVNEGASMKPSNRWM